MRELRTYRIYDVDFFFGICIFLPYHAPWIVNYVSPKTGLMQSWAQAAPSLLCHKLLWNLCWGDLLQIPCKVLMVNGTTYFSVVPRLCDKPLWMFRAACLAVYIGRVWFLRYSPKGDYMYDQSIRYVCFAVVPWYTRKNMQRKTASYVKVIRVSEYVRIVLQCIVLILLIWTTTSALPITRRHTAFKAPRDTGRPVYNLYEGERFTVAMMYFPQPNS